MALTDKQIQNLQEKVNVWNLKQTGEQDTVGGQTYEIVHKVDGTTEAIAVAPVVRGKTDYSQTAIVVAGTQTGVEPLTSQGIPVGGFTFNESTQNALKARTSLSPQYQEISRFYDQTQKKLSAKGGQVTHMSGYSQSGPPVAKKAAEVALADKSGKTVIKVTNFVDWGASSAVKSGGIGPKEVAYLNKHATIYSDSGKDLTYIDGGRGQIPYGKKQVVEARQGLNNPFGDHTYEYFNITGNALNIDYYVKRGQFVSGMTKAQVIEVAKKKAKVAKKATLNPSTWGDSTDYKTYVKEYEKTYGEFATVKTKVEESKVDKVQVSRDKSAKLQGQLKTASASKRILLRKDLVSTVAQTAKLAGEGFVTTIGARLDEEKSEISSGFETAKKNARDISQYLSEEELQEIFSGYTLSTVWDSEQEATNRTGVEQLKTALDGFGDRLTEAAEKLTEVDQTGALYFNQT